MNRFFLLLTIFVIMFSCSKDDTQISKKKSNTPENFNSETGLKSTNSITVINWADARDNYQSGWVAPSAINSSISYSTILSYSIKICQWFINIGGNTVRIQINPPTILQWCNNYKAVIDAPLTLGMKVIIPCWIENSSAGVVTNSNTLYSLWTTIINSYGSNSNVCFKSLNEPYGYSTGHWLNLCAAWLSIFSSVPRGRILVGGTGYNDHAGSVGGDFDYAHSCFSHRLVVK